MNLSPCEKIEKVAPTVVSSNTQNFATISPNSAADLWPDINNSCTSSNTSNSDKLISSSARTPNDYIVAVKDQQVTLMIKNDGKTSSTDGDEHENHGKKEEILSAETPDSNSLVSDASSMKEEPKPILTSTTATITTTTSTITTTTAQIPSTNPTAGVSVSEAATESSLIVDNKSSSQLLTSSLRLKTQRSESRNDASSLSSSSSVANVSTTVAELEAEPTITALTPASDAVTTNPIDIESNNSLASLSDNLSSSNLSWTSSIANSFQNSLVGIASGLAEQDFLSKIHETDGVILRGSITQDGDKNKNSTRLSLRAKKKSWYNVIYPTYKSRAEDFKKLFKEVSNEERLIVDYSCALQREILVQGRMYVSQNYVCFHANIFRWETYISIKWEEVTSITKEKTALVIPNAISISTDKEKYFFATFASRDKAYLMLFRIWQNTLMKKTTQPQELWQWVHNCYGEELGLTTDDEDYIDPTNPNADNDAEDDDFISAVNDNVLMVENSSNSNQSINLLDNCSINPINGNTSTSSGGSSAAPSGKLKSKKTILPNNNKLQKSNFMATSSNSSSDNKASRGKMKVFTRDDIAEVNQAINPEITTGETKETKSHNFESKRKITKNNRNQNNDTDMSDSSDSDEVKIPFLLTAVCNSPHEGRQILHTILPMNIETVFNMMFSNSKFLQDFHAMRRTENLVFGDWVNNNDGTKSREISLTVQVSASVGPKTSRVTENQHMRDCSKPNELYSIDVINTNSGIPYADSFCVMTHFCLVRTSDDNTMLSMHAQIKYKKSIWGVVKSLIEKNTWAGIEEYYTCLLQALQNETNIPPAKGKGRRPRRNNIISARINEEPSTLCQLKLDGAIDSGTNSPLVASTTHLAISNQFMNVEKKSNSYKWLSFFVLFLLAFLVVLNVILLHKLWQLEERIDEDVNSQISLPNISQLKELPTTNDDWLKLFRQQEVLHERELAKLQTILQTAIELLKKTENTLAALLLHYQ